MKQHNDELVSKAFSKQSVIFDRLDTENMLTEHLRTIYRKEIERLSPWGSSILELNCGTGVDTVYFAGKGYKMFSTDNAPGMINQLDKKIAQWLLGDNVQTMLCSYADLDKLGTRKFDHIISNFGGLNCTKDLDKVLSQFKEHLTADGKVTLVIMPKVSPWELIMAVKGDFKTAFRRFRKNTPAHIEGIHFSVYYYNPSYIKKVLKTDFQVLTLKGIYFAVPPEFYQRFVERYPKMYRFLQRVERLTGNIFPFNCCCDHYMITLKRKT